MISFLFDKDKAAIKVIVNFTILIERVLALEYLID